MKLVKRLGIVLVGLLIGGGLAAAAVLGVIPVPFGPLAEARAAAEKTRPPVTVMYPTKERVINLADPGVSRYLKTDITLEFIDAQMKEPPKGDGVKAEQDDFAKGLSPYSAIIEDALTSVLSSRTTSDLMKPDGKDKLKLEIMDRVNKALHDDEKVVNVYLTSFIIQ